MPSELGQETQEELTSLYLGTLNDREIQAYHIAVDHLGMSFTMERSNGFRQWKKDRDARIRIMQEHSPTKQMLAPTSVSTDNLSIPTLSLLLARDRSGIAQYTAK